MKRCSRDRITARYSACGPPTELPELSCRSIEKHANHRLLDTSVSPRVGDALGVSRPGFHAWLNRSPSARSRSDEAVGQWLKASFAASDPIYGVRRVWRDLLAEGVGCRPTRFRHHCTFASHQGRIDSQPLEGVEVLSGSKAKHPVWRRAGRVHYGTSG
jgi:hypothetical protein